MSGHVVLVGGGARSGKSRFALTRAREFGANLVFVATARAYDADMADRIARHQQERSGEFAARFQARFTTIEEPVALAERILALQGFDAAVVDCATLWLTNLLVDGLAADEVERRVEEVAQALGRAPCPVVLVTNEVGMGIHPETALGRLFRDLAGRANQRLAAAADEIQFAVLGTLLRLKPGPVEVRLPGAPP